MSKKSDKDIKNRALETLLLEEESQEDVNFILNSTGNKFNSSTREPVVDGNEIIGDINEGGKPLSYVNIDLIEPSTNNMKYKSNMDNYHQALIILEKLKDIDPDILSKREGLSNALSFDDNSPFLPALRPYRNQIGALKLLGIAGSIQLQEQLNAPPAYKIQNAKPGGKEYRLIDGMRRYLALLLLGEQFMYIRPFDDEKSDEEEQAASIAANIQTYQPSKSEYGRAIDELKSKNPWLNDKQIGQQVGISPNQVSRYWQGYLKDKESADSQPAKKTTVKQTIIETPNMKISYSGDQDVKSQVLFYKGVKIIIIDDGDNESDVNAVKSVLSNL